MECTRFTVRSRQAAHGLFRAIRERVARAEPELFSALSGRVVYMWFNGDDSFLSLPHRKSNDEAAEELVQALASYRPDPVSTKAMWLNMTDSAPDAPPLQLHKTTAGASFYSLPMVGSVPDSLFFNFAGFELGFAYTTSHRVTAETSRLVDEIAQKDRPGNDWLLISAGAPDNLGMTYPAEEALAAFIVDYSGLNITPLHLQRVTLHFWSVGRAVDLWPEQRELFGPLYVGCVPAARHPYAVACQFT